MPQSCDIGQAALLPLHGMLRIFFARKIRRLRSGLNPRTWVSEASMITTRPPKCLIGIRLQREFLHSLENTNKMPLRILIFWPASFSIQTNHSINPRSRVLLEKLLVLQLFSQFPTLHGTRNSNNAFTRTVVFSLS
jgi:hypothetical protein